MLKKLFGTDGIRGKANLEPMTSETILQVGKAMACLLRKTKGKTHSVLIGKDTRASGYMFETALASGLCSMGVDVILVGPISTPAVAFLTRAMRADAGAVISASHNPYDDNGVKFFGSDGFKLSDEIELNIESMVDDPASMLTQLPAPQNIGKASRLDDARGRYITYLKYNFPQHLSLKGLRVVLDCAHGATYKIAPLVFSELGATVILMGVNPDGFNINEGSGALHPEKLSQKVVESKADIGIAFDGDGDRVLFVDDQGRVFDGDDILGVMAPWLESCNELGSGVVGTVMSNFGLEKYFKTKNIPFYRSGVGDRYVVEMMRQKGCLWGGEQSGHLVSLHRSTTGDGILSSMLLLRMLCEKQKKLSDLYGVIPRYPQVIENVLVKERKNFEQLSEVTAAISHAESELQGTGRVLVRYSGTEFKARVMVEGEDESRVKELASSISTSIKKAIGV